MVYALVLMDLSFLPKKLINYVYSQGRHGRAFLFTHAMNIAMGPKEDRHLLTGLHTVADVYCADCREVLGWKYERAFEASQKYKEGKFILEKSKIVRENWQLMLLDVSFSTLKFDVNKTHPFENCHCFQILGLAIRIAMF